MATAGALNVCAMGSASLRKERGCRSKSSNVAGVGIRQVHSARTWRVGKRSSGSGIVDDVALHPFIEGSEASAKHCLAVTEQVFREADAGLQRLVVVLHQPRRRSVHPSLTYAVQIERRAIEVWNPGPVGSIDPFTSHLGD